MKQSKVKGGFGAFVGECLGDKTVGFAKLEKKGAPILSGEKNKRNKDMKKPKAEEWEEAYDEVFGKGAYTYNYDKIKDFIRSELDKRDKMWEKRMETLAEVIRLSQGGGGE